MSYTPRVLIVITHLSLGGAENVALSLVERLTSKVSFDVFSVMDLEDGNSVGIDMLNRFERLGVPVHFGTSRDFKKGGVLLAAWRLRKLMLCHHFDVVHLHTEIPELTGALADKLRLRRRTTRFLRTVHNVELWNDWRPLGKFVERQLKEAKIVGVSSAALQASRDFRLWAGIRRLPQAEVVYNGVEEPAPLERTTHHPLRVLFAGRLEKQKGADLLPRIINETASHVEKPITFTIAGDGSLREQIEREVTTLNVDWKVEIVPPIVGLPSRWNEFDVAIVPSRFEGLSLTAVEALLSGTPVVAAAAPGLVEVVPASDPLSAPIENTRELAERLVDAINNITVHRARVAAQLPVLSRKFGARSMADTYLRIYREMTV